LVFLQNHCNIRQSKYVSRMFNTVAKDCDYAATMARGYKPVYVCVYRVIKWGKVDVPDGLWWFKRLHVGLPVVLQVGGHDDE